MRGEDKIMKKFGIGFLILILCLLSFPFYAQAAIGFGVKAGMNYANISGPESENEWENRMALVAGAFFTFNVGKIFALQPEILYSQKGLKWDEQFQFEGKDFKATTYMDYLDIAALAKVFIPVTSNSAFRINLFAGPYVGLKLRGKLKYEWGGESAERDLEDLKSQDVGLVFGGGFDFAVGSGRLSVDARYGMSLSSISKVEDMKNQVFSVLLGYSFK